MSACCSGGFLAAAAHNFDAAAAVGELARYAHSGPLPSTRLLRDAVLAQGPLGSVLDVGAGVGVLTLELLAAGCPRALVVDASPAFVAAARAAIAERGHATRAEVREGDLVALAGELPRVDAVVMDRVVCCYPEPAPLLAAALGRAERVFAYSYPHDRGYMRLFDWLLNTQRAWRDNPFRTFVHDPVAMAALIERAGFERVSRGTTLAWCVDTYLKSPR